MTIDPNSPAFPMGYHRDGNSADHPGMSLREWFAGQALSAVLMDVRHGMEQGDWTGLEEPYSNNAELIASQCCIMADALLAKLNEGETP